jgi:pimeloyl-ACP methyl ester carboxylesterase
VREWPGVRGPLVHVPDPLASTSVFEALGSALAPRYRVLSLSSRGDCPYVVDAIDLRDTLRQFGFESPILLGEGLGSLTALLVAAWHLVPVGGLIVINARFDTPNADTLRAAALRDCPPNVRALRQAVVCDVVELHGGVDVVADVEAFVAATLP